MSCVGVDMLVPVNAYIEIWNVQASEGITLGISLDVVAYFVL